MHMGVSDINDRGGYGIAFVTLEDGEIAAVELKEIDGTGDFKNKEYSYQPYHKEVEEMAQRFVAANSSQIDSFTGATGSSTKWIQAVERALENSK